LFEVDTALNGFMDFPRGMQAFFYKNIQIKNAFIAPVNKQQVGVNKLQRLVNCRVLLVNKLFVLSLMDYCMIFLIDLFR
jgi:hypothetical protein